jgi:regulatory protein
MGVTRGTITAITASPRQAGRFHIEVDGSDFATVAIDSIERLRLAVGDPVADIVADALERDAAALKTYDRALNMLASRARSSSELRRQLLRKGEPPDHVHAAILRLEGAGFLDDAAFARGFAHSKSHGAGLAKRRLQQELARRGVDRRVADEAIEEVLDGQDPREVENAERIARKQLRSLMTADPRTRRRRLYAYLARRGYDSNAIVLTLERLLGRPADGEPDPASTAE